MPKTLAGSVPKLTQDLLKILQKASYEAYLTSSESGNGADPIIQNRLDMEMKKAALNYSNKFAQEAAQPLAKAIYEFVKEIGITLTPKGSLISTSIMSPSPVAGVAPMTDFMIT